MFSAGDSGNRFPPICPRLSSRAHPPSNPLSTIRCIVSAERRAVARQTVQISVFQDFLRNRTANRLCLPKRGFCSRFCCMDVVPGHGPTLPFDPLTALSGVEGLTLPEPKSWGSPGPSARYQGSPCRQVRALRGHESRVNINVTEALTLSGKILKARANQNQPAGSEWM